MTMMRRLRLSRLVVSLLGIFVIKSQQGTRALEVDESVFITFGGKAFTDNQGNKWIPESGVGTFIGGKYEVNATIKGTDNDKIYQTEMFDNFGRNYWNLNVPMANGLYELKMHFCEIYGGMQRPNARVFDIFVENVAIYKALDIFALVGGYTALTINAATRVDDESLSIQLKRIKQNPKISGLQITRVSDEVAAFVPVFINCGGGEITDLAGQTWTADNFFNAESRTWSANKYANVRLTNNDDLYRSERHGNEGGTVKYEIPMPNGSYRVTLHFAEIYFRNQFDKQGARIFDVAIEGKICIERLDIWSEAGYFAAWKSEVPAFVEDGLLTIELLPDIGDPKISGIEVEAIDEVYRWNTYGAEQGLTMVVMNAMEDKWQTIFDDTVSMWNYGEPLNLLTIRSAPDYDCQPIVGRIKLCNGDYGDQKWVGLNTVTLQDGFIKNSVARMNDYYLQQATEPQRRYALCHEMGHACGLPHTDEDYYNEDRGDCLDYTIRPEDSLSPGKFNFDLLSQLYGVFENFTRRSLKYESRPRSKEETKESSATETAEGKGSEGDEDLLMKEVKVVTEKELSQYLLFVPDAPPKNIQKMYKDVVQASEVMSCKDMSLDLDVTQVVKTDYEESCEVSLEGGYSVQIRKLLAWPDMLKD